MANSASREMMKGLRMWFVETAVHLWSPVVWAGINPALHNYSNNSGLSSFANSSKRIHQTRTGAADQIIVERQNIVHS